MDKIFRIKVSKNNVAVAEKDQMTCGSVNVYPVVFEFSADWEGLDRIALFKNQSKSIRYVLDETNTVQMPWELMTEVGSTIFAGVKGMKGKDVILPSVWANCGKVVESVIDEDGNDPSVPPGDITMDELMMRVDKLEDEMPVPMSADTLRDILTGGGSNADN